MKQNKIRFTTVKSTSLYFTVPRRGVEPLIPWLKTRCPGPLDERGSKLNYTVNSSLKQPASPAGRLTTNNKEEKKTDTAAEMQKQMAIMTPIMFGFFAYQFPLGLALYWNIFGIMGMLQQLSINREK